MKTKLYLGILGICSVMLFGACDSNVDEKTAIMEVRLTDAPAAYESVVIDIQDVQIHTGNNENDGEWISLDQVNQGVYNLLDFRNGLDTLLGTIEMPAGMISQMRLILGEENSIRDEGQTYPLITPSGQQSGIKFNIRANLTEGVRYHLWIDFDASRSIVKRGNGDYHLKPVIRTYSEAVSGAIAGTVSPAISMPYVMAVSAEDTMGSYADANGNFLIKSMPEGSWTVFFTPVVPYMPDTVWGVDVVTGQVTQMDTVFLTL